MSQPRDHELAALCHRGGPVLKSCKQHPKGVLVLSRSAPDPYYVVGESMLPWGEWFAEQWGRFGERGHLRFVHYQAYSVGVEAPHGNAYGSGPAGSRNGYHDDWVSLNLGARVARYRELVDPEVLEDKRNAEAIVNTVPRERRSPREVWLPETYGNPWELPSPRWSELEHSIEDPRFRFPRPVVSGFDCHQADQPVMVEVWIEKSTMNDILIPACDQLGVNLVAGTGYESITRIIEFIRRAETYGRHAHILYVSDADTAGAAMPFQVARQVQFWLDVLKVDTRATLEPVALTRDQIDAYELDRFENPSRPGQIELDALEALHPGALADIISEAVSRYRDSTLSRRLAATRDDVDQQVSELWERETLEFRSELADIETDAAGVVARFQADQAELAQEFEARQEALAADLAAALAEHRDRLDELWQEAAPATRSLLGRVEVPERPAPELPDMGEDRFLFDSSRDWRDQLDVYRRFANGNGEAGR